MSRLNRYIIRALLAALSCGSTASTAEPLSSQKTKLPWLDSVESCIGQCGEKAAANCWCDTLCHHFADCCADKEWVCDPRPTPLIATCQGHCGALATGGCWCDDACTSYGDCCQDVEAFCAAKSGPLAIPKGSPGADCDAKAHCEVGLECNGIPKDGSTDLGKCNSTTAEPGQGVPCSADNPCGDGLICPGLKLVGYGECAPEWMGSMLTDSAPVAIPDDNTPLTRSVVAYGLASVPMDVVLTVNSDHPRPTDLAVTLTDPNGTIATVALPAASSPGLLDLPMVISQFPGDETVNGRWTLTLVDTVSGLSGTLHSWSLELTSRWD